MEGRIRRAHLEDAGALAALQARGLSHFFAPGLPRAALAGATKERFLGAWQEAIQSPPSPDWRIWVIEMGQDLRGFVHTGPSRDPAQEVTTTSVVHALHIDPDAGKVGLGRTLLTWCVDDLRDRGYLTTIAWCPTKAPGARHFLEAGGFQIDGPPAKRELHGGPCEQLRYKKLLQKDPTL